MIGIGRRGGRALAVTLLGALATVAPPGAPTAAAQRRPLVDRSAWAGAALVAGSVLLDRPGRDYALDHRTRELDAVARAGNAMGSGRYLIAGMAAAYGVGWVARREWSRDVLHVAAAYTAGNVIVSVLKPAVGRQRPYVTGHPDRLRPFTASGDWHSFPSAHAIHAFTLAAAVAEEAHRPWVSAVGYGAAAVVAWSRVYQDQHWTSDVVAGGVLGAVTAKATVRWLHGRGRPDRARR